MWCIQVVGGVWKSWVVCRSDTWCVEVVGAKVVCGSHMWCVQVIILEDGSSLLTQVYNTYNNSDNNRSNPLKLNVFLSNQTP